MFSNLFFNHRVSYKGFQKGCLTGGGNTARPLSSLRSEISGMGVLGTRSNFNTLVLLFEPDLCERNDLVRANVACLVNDVRRACSVAAADVRVSGYH